MTPFKVLRIPKSRDFFGISPTEEMHECNLDGTIFIPKYGDLRVKIPHDALNNSKDGVITCGCYYDVHGDPSDSRCVAIHKLKNQIHAVLKYNNAIIDMICLPDPYYK